jgi:protocatechuate 3,4-dioxygenase beta subunit
MVRFSTLHIYPPTRMNPTTSYTVPLGESIASEGKGEYMYVEGRVLTSKGEPIPGAVIETWETDEKGEQHLDVVLPLLSNGLPSYVSTPVPNPLGFYDTQYTERSVPDCRGRLRTDSEGTYGYRAVVPVSYPIPGDVGHRRSSPFRLPTHFRSSLFRVRLVTCSSNWDDIMSGRVIYT